MFKNNQDTEARPLTAPVSAPVESPLTSPKAGAHSFDEAPAGLRPIGGVLAGIIAGLVVE